MKVRIEVECTPDEARAFFGLPEVAPAQAAALAKLQERLEEAMAAAAPEDLMKAWMPAGMKGMQTMQNMFWQTAGAKPDADNE